MADTQPDRKITRLEVNIGPQTLAALELLVSREGLTLTEALRRLVAFGEVVYRTARIDGGQVLLRNGDSTREVIVS